MTDQKEGEHGRKPIYWDPEQHIFTFKTTTPSGAPTQNPIPAKFSTTDRYGKYRRAAKAEQQQEEE